MKRVLKYIIIFIITVFTLFSALVASSTIPHSAIEDKVKESLIYYKQRAGIHRIKNKRIYSYIHYYADTRKLNILYCIDSEHPIQSTLWSKYYQVVKKDTPEDFIDLVENNREPNTQYLRYWNGCMLFLRPLLTIFNMEQIYAINKYLLIALALVLAGILFKKSKKLLIIFLIALILTSSWYATLCIEYTNTLYTMVITAIIAIIIDSKKIDEKEKDYKLFKLFLVTGIVTCFFDFLSTEILTIFVPLLMILIIRNEEKRLGKFKKIFKFVAKICILWFIGYAGMWIAKWVLASLILHINAIDYIKENFLLRINGLQGARDIKEVYSLAYSKNIYAIPVLEYAHRNFYKVTVKTIKVIVVVMIILCINWKELKNKKYLGIIFLIGLAPYMRYGILANHSYRHAMFTFRDQIITIMAILYIIIDCFNSKLLFKKLKIRKNKDIKVMK